MKNKSENNIKVNFDFRVSILKKIENFKIIKNEGSKANKGSQTPIFIQSAEKGDVIWLVFEVRGLIVIHFGICIIFNLKLTSKLFVDTNYDEKDGKKLKSRGSIILIK